MTDLWNLPVDTSLTKESDCQPYSNHLYERPGRYLTLTSIAQEHFAHRAIDVLEIGVFRAGLIRCMFASEVVVKSYVGVDPFLGTKADPYLGAYWRNEDEADRAYNEAQEIFNQHDQEIHRVTSKQFSEQIHPDRRFDLIVVDGDHRYSSALWDMSHWFYKLHNSGMLLVDDYSNPDTPDVTRAVNAFIIKHRPNIQRMGYRTIEFINKGKEVPIVQSFVYFEPVVEHERRVSVAGKHASPHKSAASVRKSFVRRLAKWLKGLRSEVLQ